jgi:hypothetical protein
VERISYITTEDGEELGVVYGQIALKMEEIDNGQFVIKTSENFEEGQGWCLFFGSYDDNPIRSKTEFYEFVSDCADHMDEVKLLDRQTTESNVQTPWGQAYSQISFGEGVTYFTTGISFGFRVDREVNQTIPTILRTEDGWYADMVEDHRVILGLPDHFTSSERKQAERQIKRDEPHLWQALQAHRELEQAPAPFI